eukprot:TRINITY_DN5522_c0_g2_i2.p1 TRINITY_DN5522_c0_g2~~TRINITY_DN5522_c0_g2_i2.p1  ORF type:complete len:658 (+),score=221.80 TRINITY_DN5522_c0_g2_i2:128-2101(+)
MAGQSKLATTYGGMVKHFVSAVWNKPDSGGQVLMTVWGGSILVTLLIAIGKKQRERSRARKEAEMRLAEAAADERRRLFESTGKYRDEADQEQTEAERKLLAAREAQEARDKYVKGGMLAQLRQVLDIAFPSLVSSTSVHVLLYTVFLLLRILLTIKIAKVTGALGKTVGSRSFTQMFQLQVVFGLWCVPAAAVNALLKFEQSQLSLSIRKKLVARIHEQYMDNLVYYRASNMGRHRIEDIDQRATQDLKKFSNQVCELYGNLLKPVFEVILLSRTLSAMMGGRQLLFFFAYFLVASQWLRAVMPPFSKYAREHQRLEGEFRGHHSRLITYAEEIAFYGGAEREKEIVDESFANIYNLYRKENILKCLMGILDGYVVKYGGSMVAYSMLMPAVYLGLYGLKGKSAPEVMEYYLTSTQLFVSLGNACKHLVLSYKRIQALSGLTVRVSSLFNMLGRRGGATGRDEEEEIMKANAVKKELDNHTTPVIKEGGDIEFENVNLFSPAGQLLVKGLTFSVRRNTNVQVTGPNGSGKSSLFRVLGGLWPLCSGRLTKPRDTSLFYVPQKPYLAPGTLRDQLTYPKHLLDKSEDDQLFVLMQTVNLGYLVEREGWDTIRDWADVLSGGEKQRVAMARLFYHKPEFGILVRLQRQSSLLLVTFCS